MSRYSTFSKLDRENKDVISVSEFQALLESRFGLELSKIEFEKMLRRVPLDKKGNVRYPDFLATFDAGRFDNQSLFEVRLN